MSLVAVTGNSSLLGLEGQGAAYNTFAENDDKPKEAAVLTVNEAAASPQPMTADAATKIQTIFRGWRTRKAVVLPHHILPVVGKHLLPEVYDGKEAKRDDESKIADGEKTDAKLRNTVRGLCREINKISQAPHAGKNQVVCFSKSKPNHHFPVFSKNGSLAKTETVVLDFFCCINKSDDLKKVNLLIAPSKMNFLGKGTYQTTYKAQGFEIPLSLQKEENGRCLRSVTYKRKTLKQQNMVDDESGEFLSKEILATERDTILDGISIQKELCEMFKGVADVKLAAMPVLLNINTTPQAIIMQQGWYNTDLRQATQNGAVPLDFSEKPLMKKMRLKDKLNVCLDVARTLKHLSSKGIVHRDVKPSNILISIDSAGEIVGHLSDFDLTTLMGKFDDNTEYAYWDLCGQSGWAIPFSDLYGIALTLGEAVFPGFHRIRDNPDEYLAHDLRVAIKKGCLIDFYKGEKHPKARQAAAAIFDLIVKVYDKNAAAFAYLKSNEKLQDAIRHGSSEETLAAAAAELATNSFSIDEFIEALAAIRKELDPKPLIKTNQ